MNDTAAQIKTGQDKLTKEYEWPQFWAEWISLPNNASQQASKRMV
jgi:hypothetical protein